jgi:very-short-patch-repair endonuclease
VLDAALHKKLIQLKDVPRHRGYVEPATESPMETRLRMLLVLAGLPRPKVQVPLGDATTFLGRADLYYPDHRLVIEYDGATHKESLAADNRRQNLLIRAGYTVLRFTASDVLGFPDGVVALVRSALSAPESEPRPGPSARPGRSAPRPGPGAPRAA